MEINIDKLTEDKAGRMYLGARLLEQFGANQSFCTAFGNFGKVFCYDNVLRQARELSDEENAKVQELEEQEYTTFAVIHSDSVNGLPMESTTYLIVSDEYVDICRENIANREDPFSRILYETDYGCEIVAYVVGWDEETGIVVIQCKNGILQRIG